MKAVRVLAGEDRRVRLENGAVLDGKIKDPVTVARTIYIERRLQCGDLVDVDAQKTAPAPASAPAPEAAKTDAPPAAPKPADVKAA